MSTATITEPSSPTIPRPAEPEPAALFRYSMWLHVGAGAGRCQDVDERAGVNGCGDGAHWHAWCRLPNPLQQAEIRERALAAKARKIRRLRDPESDACAILDEEFAARAREGELARATAVDELVAIDYWRDYYESMMEVRQIGDPDSEDEAKLYAHIEDDQRRYERLEQTPEDQRSGDEHSELSRHLDAYQQAINEAMRQRTEPRREALEALDTPGLLAQLRDKRVEAESQQEFQRVFGIHEWLSCAYRQPGGAPAFANLASLESAPPEVIEALQVAFTELKRAAQEAQGN